MLNSKVLSLRRPSMQNEKGMAVLEMIPVIIVVMVMLRYSLGFFGVIHSATLQSIAARNYSFETFRHRSRLTYLREINVDKKNRYTQGVRFHGISDENFKETATGDADWVVSRRDITFPPRETEILGAASFTSRMNDQKNITPGRRFNESDGVNPVWLSIRYGMCIDFNCGEQGQP